MIASFASSSFAPAIALMVAATAHAVEPGRPDTADQRGSVASEIAVTTTSDDIDLNGNCTLREAIIAANSDSVVDACSAGSGSDTISLPAGDYLLSLPGNESEGLAGDLDVWSDIMVLGAGRDDTTIDGGGLDRVFEIFGGGNLVLRRLTVRGGATTSAGAQIRIATTGSLDASSVRITGTPENTQNALYINANATATLRQCLIDSNLEGAIFSQADSDLVIDDCIVRDNATPGSGSGGAIQSNGNVTILSSAFFGNSAGFGGGAIISSGRLVLANSTVVDNHCGGQGGAIYNVTGELVIHSSTIARNTSGSLGAGIYQLSNADQTASTTLSNTILADNSTASGAASDCWGSETIVSTGYSLLGSTIGCPLFVSAGAGDIVDVDPLLGSLDNHGGGTRTVELLSGSPAIDTGDPTGCRDVEGNVLHLDQRGFVRFGPCDIGAFEADSPGSPPLFGDGFEGEDPITSR